MNSKRIWRRLAILLTVALMMVPIAAVQAAPGGNPGPPPGKGEDATASNNLSVPAIIVDGDFSNVLCPQTGVIPPSGGDPLTGYPIDTDAYYFVQGVHSWQAECVTAEAHTINAIAEWGDNLSGAPLKANTPIRVEIGLIEATGAEMYGYLVEKLEPDKLDREAAYGTLATALEGGGWSATETQFPWTGMVPGEEGELVETTIGVRVYDEAATFSICPVGWDDPTPDPSQCVVPPGTPMTAEINSTGKIVYGYNWGVGGHGVKSLPQAGTYEITFVTTNVILTGANVGSSEEHSATITVTVAPKDKPGKGPKPKAETYFGDQLQLRDQARDQDQLHR